MRVAPSLTIVASNSNGRAIGIQSVLGFWFSLEEWLPAGYGVFCRSSELVGVGVANPTRCNEWCTNGFVSQLFSRQVRTQIRNCDLH